MAYIHLSTDPANKRGVILLSDSKEFNPASGYPCYEIINTKAYPSADNISWYIHQQYKGFTWIFDCFV